MVTVRTIRFKTEDLFIWPTQHFYILCVIPSINSIYLPNRIIRLLYVMEMQCVYCEVGICAT